METVAVVIVLKHMRDGTVFSVLTYIKKKRN